MLHVRKGKNQKERLIPISRHSLFYLQEWVYDQRSHLAGGSNKNDALLISCRGKRMQGQSLFIRLKKLQYDTGNINLIKKEIGLHTLTQHRHTLFSGRHATGKHQPVFRTH
ncbi:MAG: tyrosine-type recombinase/integrase [Bacteroidota bacterium]